MRPRGGMNVQALPQVICSFSSEPLLVRVAFLLEAAGFGISRHHPSSLISLPIKAGPIVAQAGMMESHTLLSSTISTRSDLGPWIFVADGDRPPQEHQPTAFLVPDQASAFLSEVRYSWTAATACRFARIAREDRSLHVGLSVAISRIVAPELMEQILSGRALIRPPKPVTQGLLTWLSREVGMSSDHLSRLARKNRISLPAIWDGWRIFLAIVLRLEHGSWERAAFYLGFEGASGLTSLSYRTLGSSPRGLEREPCLGLARAKEHIFALLTDPALIKRETAVEYRLGESTVAPGKGRVAPWPYSVDPSTREG